MLQLIRRGPESAQPVGDLPRWLSALLRANPCLAPSDFKQGACINIPED